MKRPMYSSLLAAGPAFNLNNVPITLSRPEAWNIQEGRENAMETPAYNPAARHWFAGVMRLRRLNSVSDTTAPNSHVTKNIRNTPIDCALSLYGSRVSEFHSTSVASRGNWEGS